MTDQRPSGELHSQPPTNLREHRRRTERNLIIGGFVIIFVVGGGLIWVLYGAGAAVTGWICMGSIVPLFGVLYLVLKLMEMWSAPGGE